MSGSEKRKILVVDDERDIRSLLKCALTNQGNQVFEADCSSAALHLAAEHGPFDLVISDVLMPGMDGIDLAARLHVDGHAKTFLLMSGYCDGAGWAARTRGLPASSFLAKPFTIPDLLVAVRDLLEDHGSRRAAVRDHHSRRAFRGFSAAFDPSRRLRMRSQRLCALSRRLLTEADRFVHVSRWVRRDYQGLWAAALELHQRVEQQRAIVKECALQR